MIIGTHMGEAIHHLKNGRVRHFTPQGPIYYADYQGRAALLRERARRNPIERIGSGGLSARLFVGLKVGTRTKYKLADIIRIVWEVREKQRRSPDASILAQSGIYKDKRGRRIVEPSVQIIIIDFESLPKELFLSEMQALAEDRSRLQQETVILEIQNRGQIEDVYTVT